MPCCLFPLSECAGAFAEGKLQQVSASGVRDAVAVSTGWHLREKSTKCAVKHIICDVFDQFTHKLEKREQMQQEKQSQAKEAPEQQEQQSQGGVECCGLHDTTSKWLECCNRCHRDRSMHIATDYGTCRIGKFWNLTAFGVSLVASSSSSSNADLCPASPLHWCQAHLE
jgi:hypothetical protein